jgi:hypothetical protein
VGEAAFCGDLEQEERFVGGVAFGAGYVEVGEVLEEFGIGTSVL